MRNNILILLILILFFVCTFKSSSQTPTPIPTWSAVKKYSKGDMVIHDNKKWLAMWDVWPNNEPYEYEGWRYRGTVDITPIIGPFKVRGHKKLKLELVFQYPVYSENEKTNVVFLGFKVDNDYSVSVEEIEVDYKFHYKNKEVGTGTAELGSISRKYVMCWIYPALYLTDSDAMALKIDDISHLKITLVDIRAYRK